MDKDVLEQGLESLSELTLATRPGSALRTAQPIRAAEAHRLASKLEQLVRTLTLALMDQPARNRAYTVPWREFVRWVNPSTGGTIILHATGELHERLQAVGEFRLVRKCASLDEAEAYVRQKPGWKRTGMNREAELFEPHNGVREHGSH